MRILAVVVFAAALAVMLSPPACAGTRIGSMLVEGCP
jgi:hypothetical protein